MSQGINICHLPKSLQRDIVAGEEFRQQMNHNRENADYLALLRTINKRLLAALALPATLFDSSSFSSYAAVAHARHRRIVRSHLLPLLAWIFIAASAFAQVAVPANVIAATATIKNCTGAQCLQGSTTLIDKGNGRGLVLTTGHLLDIGQGTLTVTFPGLPAVRGELLGYDPLLDVAAVDIPEPPIAPLDLADSPPNIGDPMHSLGYGSGRLAGITGQLLGYYTQQDDRGTRFPEGALLTMNGTVTSGDSGGPMLDRNWKVCGVIMGTGRSSIDGAACPRVRRFLERFRPRYRRANAAAGQRPYSRVPAPAPAPGNIAAPSDAPPYNSQQPTPAPYVQPNLPAPAPAPVEDGSSGPAAWIAERATLEQSHADQMRAKAAENAALQKQLADDRVRFESQAQALPPPKSTPSLTSQPRVSEPNSPLSETLERGAETIAKNVATKLLLSYGLPGGLVAVGVPAVWWLVKRRAKKKNLDFASQLDRLRQRVERITSPAAPAAAAIATAGDAVPQPTAPPTATPQTAAATDAGTVQEIYTLSDKYAENLAQKNLHEGMSIPQEALLGRLYKSAMQKFKRGEFDSVANPKTTAMQIEFDVLTEFLQKHGVTTSFPE